MPWSARWLIIAGYAALVAGFVVGDMLPRGRDELGIAKSMSAVELGALVGAILLLAGMAQGARTLVRARGRVRWFDYALLTIGLAPFVLVAVGLLLPG